MKISIISIVVILILSFVSEASLIRGSRNLATEDICLPRTYGRKSKGVTMPQPKCQIMGMKCYADCPTGYTLGDIDGKPAPRPIRITRDHIDIESTSNQYEFLAADDDLGKFRPQHKGEKVGPQLYCWKRPENQMIDRPMVGMISCPENYSMESLSKDINDPNAIHTCWSYAPSDYTCTNSCSGHNVCTQNCPGGYTQCGALCLLNRECSSDLRTYSIYSLCRPLGMQTSLMTDHTQGAAVSYENIPRFTPKYPMCE